MVPYSNNYDSTDTTSGYRYVWLFRSTASSTTTTWDTDYCDYTITQPVQPLERLDRIYVKHFVKFLTYPEYIIKKGKNVYCAVTRNLKILRCNRKGIGLRIKRDR